MGRDGLVTVSEFCFKREEENDAEAGEEAGSQSV